VANGSGQSRASAEFQAWAPSFGFDVTLLIDIGNTMIAAEEAGKLIKQYTRIAHQAHIIVGASEKAGIKGGSPSRCWR
jgi:hypothetical protein